MGSAMKPQFVIKHNLVDGIIRCSMSCSFWTYEGRHGCRAGCADGFGHPGLDCPEPGVYKLTKDEE
jgi:hypothetical protein